MEKILVTGMGIVSAIGMNVTETLAAIREGKSGVGRLKYLQTEHTELPCAEVARSNEELRNSLHFGPSRIAPRTALLGIVALQEALDMAHLTRDDGLRVAFINGTTVGGMDISEQHYHDFLENDGRNIFIKEHECGATTQKIAETKPLLFQYITTLSTACSSGANAVALGANLIKAGLMDVAVVGGSECLTRYHLNGFNSLMILDHEPCRPFDDSRAGLNLGEGAAYLVLEKESTAKGRNATPIGELSGYGNACDAFHQTATSADGKGLQLSMQKALRMSGLETSEVDYINAHGTGTPNNDLSEGRAIKAIFGSALPAISSTKAMTGHTTSASGSIEAVVSLLALENGLIPGNLRFRTPMKELPLEPVVATLERELQHVLTNSCGFGGNCTTLIFSKI
jgi:3-oxoacyl-[acyl-carrier-protein] synthase II